jgi:membrane protease YdiL (CAAX protease family)
MLKSIIFTTLAVQVALSNILIQGFKQVYSGNYFCFYQKLPELYDESPAIFYFGVCVVGPFFEEFIFRKALLGGLIKKFSAEASIILSSCSFALSHDQYWTNGFYPLAIMQMFLFGLVCSYVYLSRLSFLDSFFVHGSINAIGTFWLLFVIDFKISCVAVSATLMVFYIVLNLALLTVLIVLLIKYDGDVPRFSDAIKHKGLALLTKFNK